MTDRSARELRLRATLAELLIEADDLGMDDVAIALDQAIIRTRPSLTPGEHADALIVASTLAGALA